MSAIIDKIKKYSKNTLIIILVIALGIMLILRGCSGDHNEKIIKKIAQNTIGEIKENYFEKPSIFTHGKVRVDTVYVIEYLDPPPTVNVSGGTITSSGDVSFEIGYGSAYSLLNWRTGHYYGLGRISVPDSNHIEINYPRIAFEPILSAGLSLNGPGVSIETLHFNNFLTMETALHFPVLYMETDYNTGEFNVGVAASIDIFPENTNLRIGAAGTVDLGDLSQRRFTVFLHTDLVGF